MEDDEEYDLEDTGFGKGVWDSVEKEGSFIEGCVGMVEKVDY